MRYATLGRSGPSVSRIGFGCGDAARLMVVGEERLQASTVGIALESGITYFDTAAKYGNGESERALGRALAAHRADVVVGSKLILDRWSSLPLRVQVRNGLTGTLTRLGRSRVELYQLHDRIDPPHRRGWAPAGGRRLTPAEILAPGGLGDALVGLRDEGLVGALGLTAFGGTPEAILEVLDSGIFASVNASLHMLNPTAAAPAPTGWPQLDYGGVATEAAARGLGVLAIRALASGRLAGLDPTLPFPAFEHPDVRWTPAVRAAAAAELLPRGDTAQAAIGWVLAQPVVSTVVCGFSEPAHVTAAVTAERSPAWSEQQALSWGRTLLSMT